MNLATLLALALLLGACAGVGSPTSASSPSPSPEPPAFRYGLRPGEIVGRKMPTEAPTHVADGVRVTYASNPPTSGAHWAIAAQWSTYDTQQPFERTVHNLEHGGIVILFAGLSPTETLQLRDLAFSLRSSNLRKIVLMPYVGLTDAKVVVTAWAWESRLGRLDEEAIVKFVKAHYDGPDAPEPGAA